MGLVGAITVARLLEKLLFGISPWDFNAYLGAIAALGIAAVLAIRFRLSEPLPLTR